MTYRIILLSILFCFVFSYFNTAEGEKDMSETIEKSKESIVSIVFKLDDEKFIFAGTGFFVSADGYIITCEHVIRDLATIHIILPENLSNTTQLGYIKIREIPQPNLPVFKISNKDNFIPVTLIDSSRQYDWAILKANLNKRHFLTLGDYNTVREGDEALFLGFPFSNTNIITHKAMISYKGNIDIEANKVKGVQLDGIVNRGNSGGPLISVESGEVLGIVRATYGNIGPYLKEIAEGKRSTQGVGLGQIDFGLFAREVVNAVDRHIQMGIGYATSIEYSKEKMLEIEGKKRP